MVYPFSVLSWTQNPVDYATLPIACYVGLHVGFSSIQTSLIHQALKLKQGEVGWLQCFPPTKDFKSQWSQTLKLWCKVPLYMCSLIVSCTTLQTIPKNNQPLIVQPTRMGVKHTFSTYSTRIVRTISSITNFLTLVSPIMLTSTLVGTWSDVQIKLSILQKY